MNEQPSPLAVLERMLQVFLIAVAILSRLVLAWGFHGNFDQDSYELVQGIVRDGGNVYAETTRYNYAPPWFLVLGAFAWLQELTGLPAHGVIRTFLTLADIALAGVVYILARHLGLAPLRACLLFLLNPVSILITGFHGPVDGLAILFIWLAVLVQHKRLKSWLASGLCLVGLLLKPIVAPAPLYALAPSIPSYWRRLLVVAAMGVVFGLTFLPWLADGRDGIARNVLAYGAASTSSPGAGPSVVGLVRVAILVGAGVFATRTSVDRAVLLWALLTIVTQPYGPEQQYILPLAAGALRPSLGFGLFSVVATVALLGSPDNLHIVSFGQLGEWLVWVVAVSWLVGLSLSFRVPQSPKQTSQRDMPAAI